MTTSRDLDAVRLARRLVSARRKALGAKSLEAFAHLYLPAHFKDPPSRMHREVMVGLQEITLARRGARVAVAAPRGHAKSTIVSLACVLWCICYDREKFIILISNTAGQADDLLSHVKAELESNPRLLVDFPRVCEEPGTKPGPPRWRQDEIITRNGVRICAFGAEKKIRGRRHRQDRPGLIILDDVENEELVASQDRREKLLNWFTKAVLKAGDRRTNVVAVGTIMHYGSLLADLVDPQRSPGWEGRKYKAVLAWSARPELWEAWEKIYNDLADGSGKGGPEAAGRFFAANREAMLAGTEVLWPEREDYYRLMEMRLTEGVASFDSEKQNEPINPAECLFRVEDMVFWDDQYHAPEALFAAVGHHGEFYGACDPSLGKAGRHRDGSAIITILRDRKTGFLYVIDADIARRPPDEIIQAITEYHRVRKYRAFGFECNHFQDVLADDLTKYSREKGHLVPIRKITSKGDKVIRIQGLQPKVKTGTIRFSRKHRTLLDQLRQFPKAAHDDGPDALEMAVSVAADTIPVVELPPDWDRHRGHSLFPHSSVAHFPGLPYRIF